MIKIDQSDTPPIPGKFYLVPCIRVERRIEGFYVGDWVPIVGGVHSDPEIGADFLHAHYDRRFVQRVLSSPLIVVAVRAEYGYPHFPSHDTLIEYRRKKCWREQDKSFRNYADQVVRSLETLMPPTAKMVDFICPHRGVSLASVPQKKGCVTCPAHGLAWQVKTGKLVKLPTFS
jgi:Rieske [2Fe-2S] domain